MLANIFLVELLTVMEGTKQPSSEAQQAESHLADMNQRPKRVVTKPQYLKDFM